MATRVLDDEWQTPEFTLVSHINHTLMNTFREQRVVGGFPGELDSPVTENHIEHVTVPVDGGRRGRRVRHAHRHRPARICHRGRHERSDTYRCGRARSSSLCDLCLRDTFRAALTELINGLSTTCGQASGVALRDKWRPLRDSWRRYGAFDCRTLCGQSIEDARVVCSSNALLCGSSSERASEVMNPSGSCAGYAEKITVK